jgi:hypothetical protein
MSWKWIFTFQVPGNGITKLYYHGGNSNSLEAVWSPFHRRINSA